MLYNTRNIYKSNNNLIKAFRRIQAIKSKTNNAIDQQVIDNIKQLESIYKKVVEEITPEQFLLFNLCILDGLAPKEIIEKYKDNLEEMKTAQDIIDSNNEILEKIRERKDW